MYNKKGENLTVTGKSKLNNVIAKSSITLIIFILPSMDPLATTCVRILEDKQFTSDLWSLVHDLSSYNIKYIEQRLHGYY